ncbi:hypothetical protein D9758_008270 [Tetrapyrgos nigripes]|uniref:Carboxypeptidase n=1 Tax=Tetrapyrgos nigripes TaxID=182062 RepID=A0A8H5G1C2_9AGAR|nr:hypothetical protein D9758_008270 [Tetrapyrgos nigripes]
MVRRGLFSLALVFGAILPSLGGRVRLIDGVLGGVRRSKARRPELVSRSVNDTTEWKLRVTENSGVCETTPGVYQASGYVDIAANKSIFFWYFDARNNSKTTPLALWFNGGLGPCRINNDSASVSLNHFSWNTNANMLFIDQPIGTDWSHGTTDVGTSDEAAEDIWTFLQAFLSDIRFAHLQQRNLALWGQSYCGHYLPAFAAHFLDQNTAIGAGTIPGIPLNLKILGIGNGFTDPIIQYPAYMSYAGTNPYHPLVDPIWIDQSNYAWTKPGGCKEQAIACDNSNNDTICSKAQDFCDYFIYSALLGDYDPYYVLSENPDPYPADITDYMDSIQKTVGAEVQWGASDAVYDNFAATGDLMRSSRPKLEKAINAGVRTILYAGDADYIVNYQGVGALADALNTQFTEEYNQQEFSNFTVHGQVAGLYKNAGTFSYLRVYGAGHLVPAYKYGNLDYGEAALQMFDQIMSDQSLFST